MNKELAVAIWLGACWRSRRGRWLAGHRERGAWRSRSSRWLKCNSRRRWKKVKGCGGASHSSGHPRSVGGVPSARTIINVGFGKCFGGARRVVKGPKVIPAWCVLLSVVQCHPASPTLREGFGIASGCGFSCGGAGCEEAWCRGSVEHEMLPER